jgi:hypothetical protein
MIEQARVLKNRRLLKRIVRLPENIIELVREHIQIGFGVNFQFCFVD